MKRIKAFASRQFEAYLSQLIKPDCIPMRYYYRGRVLATIDIVDLLDVGVEIKQEYWQILEKAFYEAERLCDETHVSDKVKRNKK